jgi:hypothetical protein
MCDLSTQCFPVHWNKSSLDAEYACVDVFPYNAISLDLILSTFRFLIVIVSRLSLALISDPGSYPEAEPTDEMLL